MANDFDSMCIHVLVIVQADNGLQFDAAQARLNGLFDGVAVAAFETASDAIPC